MTTHGADDAGGADFAALIEAAYRTDGTDADWLRRIVACAQPGLDRGRGLVGCLFVPGADGAAAVTAAVGVGALPADPAELAAAFLPVIAGRASGVFGGAACGNARAAARAGGTRDCSAVIATSAGAGSRSDTGCALLAPLSRSTALSRSAAAVWSRVAQHLAAALRIRRAVPHEQAVWRGLLTGRWALVDHFDAGGRRFIIARGRAMPPVPVTPSAPLSDRERDACSRAAAGYANKVIAAELGVAVSTVGMLLLRATRKLRCASREELIRAFRFVEDPWKNDASVGERPRADEPRAPHRPLGS